ncbi:YbfB/YjiJ family MFS transporter [Microvirga sp. RSM25]|uniref:YbfB/YjiJ family MFS transporter n=1 Tax=Microvirga sp. RSM25 TaxID=3273802 RepID=UPI00384DCBB1
MRLLRKSAWSKATVCFAICQALAAYGMSLLFNHTGGNYRVLFGLGAGSLLLALAIDLVAGLVKPRDLKDA